jgi:hypothetical protein
MVAVPLFVEDFVATSEVLLEVYGRPNPTRAKGAGCAGR